MSIRTLRNAPLRLADRLGRAVIKTLDELGYMSALLAESLYWLLLGWRRRQHVRSEHIFQEAMQIGVRAVPIVALLALAVGFMLAIQGIDALEPFGAESKVVIGVALAVTREFSPLIVGVLVAGRSGSAITARIGTMVEAQEVDALRVMGINPVRYLAAPVLLAMFVVVPALTVLADFAAILGGGIFTSAQLGVGVTHYLDRTLDVLTVDDIRQGLVKSVVFAAIIAAVGVSNGFQVHGGAAGVGRATTRSVVMSISLIVLADMVFTFLLNR